MPCFIFFLNRTLHFTNFTTCTLPLWNRTKFEDESATFCYVLLPFRFQCTTSESVLVGSAQPCDTLSPAMYCCCKGFEYADWQTNVAKWTRILHWSIIYILYSVAGAFFCLLHSFAENIKSLLRIFEEYRICKCSFAFANSFQFRRSLRPLIVAVVVVVHWKEHNKIEWVNGAAAASNLV